VATTSNLQEYQVVQFRNTRFETPFATQVMPVRPVNPQIRNNPGPSGEVKWRENPCQTLTEGAETHQQQHINTASVIIATLQHRTTTPKRICHQSHHSPVIHLGGAPLSMAFYYEFLHLASRWVFVLKSATQRSPTACALLVPRSMPA
jgi:hypothetical protein